MAINVRAKGFFSISSVVRLQTYREIVECIAIIVQTYHSQDRRFASNLVFSNLAQIDRSDRHIYIYIYIYI